jgi:gluconolactonase
MPDNPRSQIRIPPRIREFPERIKRKLNRIAAKRGYCQALHEDFPALFPEGVAIEEVATGFRFTEGPVWFADEGFLLFSDIPGNKIFRLVPRRNAIEVYREPSGHSNGLTRDEAGRLIACEHSNRRLTRTEHDGSITVLVDSYQGKRLNSPNDVVVTKEGAIYFTDPPYGIEPHEQELPFQGIYRLDPASGEVTLVSDDLDRPNGLAFSPDEKTLYVTDSSARCHLKAFSVQNDGALANGRIFCPMKIRASGSPDGVKTDSLGRIFCTGPGGVWVFNPEGTLLGRMVLPEIAANCAWGDDDLCSLYITAETSLYRVRANIPGIPVPKS